jgi:hypothetical protein
MMFVLNSTIFLRILTEWLTDQFVSSVSFLSSIQMVADLNLGWDIVLTKNVFGWPQLQKIPDIVS